MKKSIWVSWSFNMLYMAFLVLASLSCSPDSDNNEGGEGSSKQVGNPKNPNGVPDGTYIDLYGYVVDGSFYNIQSNGGTAVYMYPYDGDHVTSITIPQQIEVNGKVYTVTQIWDNAFSGLHQLTSVILPNTITSLGNAVFTGCEKLSTVNLPDGVEEIKLYTFNGCKALNSITIPQSLTSIGNYAFFDCQSLTSVTLPSTLKRIGQEAFRGSGLTSAIIPDGVTELGLEAFADCKNLTSISIPASVSNYLTPFTGCDALTSVSISYSFVIGEFGTNLTELILGEGAQVIGNNAFANCTKLSKVDFPSTAYYIGNNAFANCSSLTSISLNEGLTTIENGAFIGCHQLKDVTCYATTPPRIPEKEMDYVPAFDKETQENCTLSVPSASVGAYKSAHGWSGFKNIVGM